MNQDQNQNQNQDHHHHHHPHLQLQHCLLLTAFSSSSSPTSTTTTPPQFAYSSSVVKNEATQRYGKLRYERGICSGNPCSRSVTSIPQDSIFPISRFPFPTFLDLVLTSAFSKLALSLSPP